MIKREILIPVILVPIGVFVGIIVLIVMLTNKKPGPDSFFIDKQDIELSPKLSQNDIINLKEGQKKMSNLLKVFDDICQKYNIKYFLVGGSLIGAILYKGWIPWDGDVDLVININDYSKFKKIIQGELPENMWFQNYETDKYYPRNNNINGKIRDLNSCYIEYTNNGGTQWHNGLQIDILLYNTDDKFIFSDKGEPNMTIDDIYPLKRVPFENFYVCVMNNSKKYLDNKFGKNWIKILPIDKRYPHEGKIDGFKTCDFHYNKYPNLHKT